MKTRLLLVFLVGLFGCGSHTDLDPARVPDGGDGQGSPDGDPTNPPPAMDSGNAIDGAVPEGPISIRDPELDAIAYQVDLAHTGAGVGPLTLPLKRLWSTEVVPQSEVAFPGPKVSFPIIVGDRIFAMIWRRLTNHLVALDRRDGTILWESAPIGRMTRSITAHAAYDAGRLFATETQTVRAFDAATGAELWKHVFPEAGANLGPPSAAGGFVFVGRHTGHGELAALDGATGTLLWDNSRDGMWDVSAPVVTASAVYIDSCCENVFAFHPRSGRLLWETNVNRHSVGWNVLSVYRGRVYNRGGELQPKPSGQIFDAMSGENLGSFRSLAAPAFHDGVAFFVDQGILSATDLASGAVRWVFRGDGMINTAPLVVDGRVYVGSAGGTLYALDEVAGTNAWSESVTELSPSTDTPSVNGGVFTGFNAARSTLVITSSRNIIAYSGAP